ncbi:recombinase RecT [Devosia sp. MC1541]|uniref:recombinase RecT n=1 Tax=Devosia sp. MC1541 TaxID=2725264 RepID=UPI00145DB6AE|nr:recombinase RecT [Devosia sp. MC1541]
MNHLAPISRTNSAVNVILPETIDDIWRIAKMAAVGKMAPKSLVEGKAQDEAIAACAIAIMAGAELGLTPLMALRSYAVVNGRPALWGDGLKAVVRQSGRCEFIRAGGDLTKGWCEAKRSDTGEEMRREFTWEQAQRAGLATKTGPWQQHPDMMMERRATARCLNDLFADVLGGIVSQDEAHDSEPFTDEPRVVTPPSPPTPPSPTIIEADEPIADEIPEAVTGEQDFDAATFFESLELAMAGAHTADAVEEAWAEMDVEATLTSDELNLDIATKIKQRAMKRVSTPTPPSPAQASLLAE